MIETLYSKSGEPLFFLHGRSSTYVAGVHPLGLLCHLYWGGKIKTNPHFFQSIDRDRACFSPEQKRPEPFVGKTGYDVLSYEYPTTNTGDYREPALEVIQADGTSGLRLVYSSHQICSGKAPLSGLPSVYTEATDDFESLVVELKDARKDSSISVQLSYGVFADRNVVIRSSRISNTGESPVILTRALSAALDLPDSSGDLLTLPGAWGRERWVERRKLRSGAQWIGSRRGASSHQSHPFFALLEVDANEVRGEVRGFSLVYSGNHHGGAEVDQFMTTRAVMGIQPDGFRWKLDPGESFQTPEVVLAYSGEGLGGMSCEYHRLYRERLVRGKWRDAERPILINNWEATTFRFDEDKLLQIVEAAAPLGIELFVIDDGWFGRRDNDHSSLGDWIVYSKKLPGGLQEISRRVLSHGMKFGLWFEPEMISPDSDLYRAHPDWCLHVEGRDRTEARNQLVLDFSRQEVVDAIYKQVAAILRSAPVSYLKWDMNRHLTEVGTLGREPERQGETAHRHLLGVYSFAERLITEFPELLIEGCSGGGGRYDPGMLAYMPQQWCSDNSDPIGRMKIQHGTSLVYPPCTLCAHVAPIPTHQGGRNPSMRTRGNVALAGQFGFQIDLSRQTPEDLAEAGELVALAKESRHLLRFGDYHRLLDPHSGNLGAWMFVAPDRSEAVVTAVLCLADPHWRFQPLKLRGLDPDAEYVCVHGPAGSWAGDFLMVVGLSLEGLDRDFQSLRWHLKKC